MNTFKVLRREFGLKWIPDNLGNDKQYSLGVIDIPEIPFKQISIDFRYVLTSRIVVGATESKWWSLILLDSVDNKTYNVLVRQSPDGNVVIEKQISWRL